MSGGGEARTMRCPFLKEAQVKSCQASAYRKPILSSPEQDSGELCSSPAHVGCAAARLHPLTLPDRPRCPFLQEALVQFCSAAPVPKYVPYSESSNSRCGGDTHRYCEQYLALASPGGGSPSSAPDAARGEADVEGIPVPAGLAFSRNHLWLDLGSDGSCHVGADAFLAHVLGSVDRLVFVTVKGTKSPAVVLTVHGVDLNLVFPNPIRITGANQALHTHPERLVADPYGTGWLFEGYATTGASSSTASLLRGAPAVRWMREEVSRLDHAVHELASRPDADGTRVLADGGSCTGGLPRHLTRAQSLRLFAAFFPADSGPSRPAQEVSL